jgi:PhnB protein
MSDKPEPKKSRTQISPMLSVRNGAKAVEFYKAAFGAREMFRLDGEDGTVVAELAIDGASFWVADESPPHFNFSPESLGGATTRMVLVVENPDAVFARAVAAGAKVIQPVENQPYQWRVGRVADPFGHHWEVGKPLN